MSADDLRTKWGHDAESLAAIGASLFQQPTRLTVTIPAALATAAVAAWHREDLDDAPDSPETAEEQLVRNRAGSFALIGLAVSDRGRSVDGGDVTVELDAWFVGHALDAADDAGLIS
jgi:FlaG/FlaF family flagellin (archaellin)